MREDNTCYSGCPNGYYADGGLDYDLDDECELDDTLGETYYHGCSFCYACESDCATCDGEELTDCLSCNTGDVMSVTGACLDSCEDGYYSDSDVCTVCDASCLTCGAGTEDDCLTCEASLYTYDTTCVVECPDGTEAASMVCETVEEEEEEEGDDVSAIRNLVGIMCYLLIVLILV